ncbi:hypothetical protein M8C21_022924 [Ambrosia artemisiifolia]|uniref:Uncharacterized protein n=1 Tax=Ambrosia artemisiifolia TaxID=4212 RepID=A0AAD5CZX5_AMBAR|nr:hypothetical protein M8C21_022924 [Ambrosia artemisiifolia]
MEIVPVNDNIGLNNFQEEKIHYKVHINLETPKSVDEVVNLAAEGQFRYKLTKKKDDTDENQVVSKAGRSTRGGKDGVFILGYMRVVV